MAVYSNRICARLTPLRLVAAALVSIMVANGCGGPEIATEQHLLGSHTIDRNREMPYLLWVPEGYDPSADPGYPMIVSLHGTGPTEYSIEFVMQYGLPAVLALGEQPDAFEFVVVSPQGLDAVNWWDRGQPREVTEIVDEVASQLAIDTTRVYLTGIKLINTDQPTIALVTVLNLEAGQAEQASEECVAELRLEDGEVHILPSGEPFRV